MWFSVLTDVGVLGGREAAVGSLRAAKPELEQFDLVHVTRGDAVARGVRRYQAREGSGYQWHENSPKFYKYMFSLGKQIKLL